jgi:hypothetical protein
MSCVILAARQAEFLPDVVRQNGAHAARIDSDAPAKARTAGIPNRYQLFVAIEANVAREARVLCSPHGADVVHRAKSFRLMQNEKTKKPTRRKRMPPRRV